MPRNKQVGSAERLARRIRISLFMAVKQEAEANRFPQQSCRTDLTGGKKLTGILAP